MATDTRTLNQSRNLMGDQSEVWLFGYGSLIHKVDFDYLERRPASIEGWARRFWQGSHDHRGTSDNPGRVVTLVEVPGVQCEGMAYRVTPDVFDHLDHREKNGYLRESVIMAFADGTTARGVTYRAGEDNAAFLGPAPEADIAAQIARCHGPSGSNRDYLLQLAQALRALDERDDHVFAIERHLRAQDTHTRQS